MTNNIKISNIDLANNLTIDHVNKTITVSKQFHKASGKYNTEEFKVLADLMAKFPNYRIVVKTQNRRKSNRLSYDDMAKYIANHDTTGEIMNEFLIKRGLKANEDNNISTESFLTIKKWFYEKYPELKKINETVA